MPTKKTPTERRPHASGPTMTNERRREAGHVRLSVWLDEQHAAILDALAAQDELTRTDVLRTLLRKAAKRQLPPSLQVSA